MPWRTSFGWRRHAFEDNFLRIRQGGAGGGAVDGLPGEGVGVERGEQRHRVREGASAGGAGRVDRPARLRGRPCADGNSAVGAERPRLNGADQRVIADDLLAGAGELVAVLHLEAALEET